ncbi:carbohydrate ABC transporter permease [Labedella endophytica]|uniref:Carbohydrate ABC transporter permease n=1 Tax=Labedella endophytica TaxID=1523160 RepID=A0A433JQ76_9MICO|nr:carbohydrate ABC transporter permease [Labedella endophytica]RUQ99113.1 carbohydrate ABC transporter permease [Labedella endophytica]
MKVSTVETTLTHAILVLAALIAVYPLVSIVASALQGADGFGLGSFAVAWERGSFGPALLSSAFISITVVLVTVAVVSLAGYALATMRVPGGRIMLPVLLLGLVLPYEVTVLPLYQMMTDWGILDTWWALILPQIGLSVPLGVFWMRAFFAAVPVELLEAARIDGAGRFETFRLVLLPIAGPAIATLSTILFLFTWNEFLLALVLVPQSPVAQTAPLALSFFAGAGRSIDQSVVAAAAVIVAAPIVLAYVILQRRLIAGLTEGAVK